MAEDRTWMYTGHQSRCSITPEWAEKTTEFVERAFHHVPPDHAALCARCGNTRPRSKYDMQMRLCKNGFRPSYTVWVYHGESHGDRAANAAKPSHQTEQDGDLDGRRMTRLPLMPAARSVETAGFVLNIEEFQKL